ncbi:MAG: O-antigen ligase family protein [Alsobacter sp.]
MSSIPHAPALTPAAPAAAGWARAAWVVLAVVLPLLMVVANRSAPLSLAVVAFLAGIAAWRGGIRLSALLRPATAAPEAWLFAALGAWALASCAWSAAPWLSARSLGEAVLPLLCATLAGAALAGRTPPRLALWLAIGLGLAVLLCLIELTFDLPLRRLTGGRHADYVINRPAVTLTLLVWPLVALLRAQGREIWGLPAVVLVGAVAAVSASGTAVLAMLAGSLAYAVARWHPRLALRLGLAATLVALLAAPASGDLLGRLMPGRAHEALRHSHSRERVEIWQAFGTVVRLRPLAGIGFAASPVVERDPVFAEVPPETRRLLPVGHPHNAALQVWVELGAAGALLVAGLFVLLFRRLGQLPDLALAAPLAALAAACAVALVSHGAWQGWWIAVLGATVILLRAAVAPPSSGA